MEDQFGRACVAGMTVSLPWGIGVERRASTVGEHLVTGSPIGTRSQPLLRLRTPMRTKDRDRVGIDRHLSGMSSFGSAFDSLTADHRGGSADLDGRLVEIQIRPPESSRST